MAADVTVDPDWISQVCTDLFGSPDTMVSELSGTGAGSAVVRLTHNGRSLVAKRFSKTEFPLARLVAALPADGVFVRSRWQDPGERVIAFDDGGPTTMGAELAVLGPELDDHRAELAHTFVERVDAACAVLSQLSPIPARPSGLFEYFGFSAMSPDWPFRERWVAAVLETLVRQQEGQSVPQHLVDAADAAERSMLARLAGAGSRCGWILCDANPFNLVHGSQGWQWVDVSVTPGRPESNLAPLAGAAFGYDHRQAHPFASRSMSAPSFQLMNLINGLFAIHSLFDTWWGLRAGTRDGGAPYEQSLAGVWTSCLRAAEQSLRESWDECAGLVALTSYALGLGADAR